MTVINVFACRKYDENHDHENDYKDKNTPLNECQSKVYFK